MDFINHPQIRICRLCLAHTKAYFSILENARFGDMLEALTSMRISSTDEISTVMCLKCRLNLTMAYTIQQNMLQAEHRFREKLAMKIEPEVTEKEKEAEELHIQETPTEEMGVETVKEESRDSPPGAGEHECGMCGRQFPTKQLLGRHSYGHRRKKCPICGKELTASNLRIHMEIHTGGPQICELCGVTLKNKGNLRQHLFYSHNESRHKCQFCEKAFKKKTNRDAHQRKEHGGEADFVCDSCGKKFYTARHLNTHVNMKHLKLRPHVCEFCDGRFSSKFALRTHQRQHTNETPFKCDVCGDGFRQKVSLKSHLKSKHSIVEEKTCQCTVCGKGFASKHALYTHQRIHS